MATKVPIFTNLRPTECEVQAGIGGIIKGRVCVWLTNMWVEIGTRVTARSAESFSVLFSTLESAIGGRLFARICYPSLTKNYVFVSRESYYPKLSFNEPSATPILIYSFHLWRCIIANSFNRLASFLYPLLHFYRGAPRVISYPTIFSFLGGARLSSNFERNIH